MSNRFNNPGLEGNPHFEAQEVCQHTEMYATGHCANCGEPVPDFEPTDAQIFAHYGQTKTYGDAA